MAPSTNLAFRSPQKGPHAPRPTEVIGGKYQLIRELGSGGSGTVYEAEHLVVGKRVALKLMHATLARDAAQTERFIGEARAAARIAHPNVVDIYDVGVTDEGCPYLVMELLQGETLGELITRRGALPPVQACELIAQVLSALGAAHAFGIVHRDLKPANVVVTHPRPDGPVVKVLDFGIAFGVLDPSERREEGLLGTPVYMAPEQALGREVDARTDVYAAGVVLYELLAGEPPFQGGITEVISRVIAGRPRPLVAVNPAVPRPLVLAVQTAMARSPDERPRSAYHFARLLTPYLSHAPPHSIPQGPNSADPIPLVGGSVAAEVRFFSDAPFASRPPRDFPSAHLGRVEGKPRGEPLADSILQSPIIPRAPSAPQIQLFDGIDDVERWSNLPAAFPSLPPGPEGADQTVDHVRGDSLPTAPGPASGPRAHEEAGPGPSAAPEPEEYLDDPPPPEAPEHDARRAALAIALGAAVGALLALWRVVT